MSQSGDNFQGEKHLPQSPQAGKSWVCLGNNKEASAPGSENWEGGPLGSWMVDFILSAVGNCRILGRDMIVFVLINNANPFI